MIYILIIFVLLSVLTGFRKPNGVLGCGLVGFSGTKPFDLKVIRTLLWHNSLTRGKHATGIFTPDNGIVKDAVEAKLFLASEDIKQITETSNLLMGHVRHGTSGGNNADPDAAHPWDFGDIVMMHNGTLTNHDKLASEYGLSKDSWIVDSQVLGLAIQKDFDNTPFKVLSEYAGAAAVVVYHKKRESLFVYRDTERTLYYGYLDGQMYISSLDDILEVIGCQSIKLFEAFKVHEIKDGKILSRFNIKRKKAVKNKFITKTIDFIKDIIMVKHFSGMKRMFLSDDITGFKHTVVNSYLLEGYYLESIVNVSANADDKLAKVSKSKFYKVIKVEDVNTFTVCDDNNTVKTAHYSMFNYQNFIPVKGSYVICMTDVIDKVNKGEMYEVIFHKYGLEPIVIKDHLNDCYVQSTINNFRKASETEVNEYFQVTDKSCVVIDFNKAEDKIDDIEYEIVDSDDDEDEAPDLSELMNEKYKLVLHLIEDDLLKQLENPEDFFSYESEENIRNLVRLIDRTKDTNKLLNINENSLNLI